MKPQEDELFALWVQRNQAIFDEENTDEQMKEYVQRYSAFIDRLDRAGGRFLHDKQVREDRKKLLECIRTSWRNLRKCGRDEMDAALLSLADRRNLSVDEAGLYIAIMLFYMNSLGWSGQLVEAPSRYFETKSGRLIHREDIASVLERFGCPHIESRTLFDNWWPNGTP